jgi:peptidyl-prolyl cis-trans isomerase B (cyclophilin B)
LLVPRFFFLLVSIALFFTACVATTTTTTTTKTEPTTTTTSKDGREVVIRQAGQLQTVEPDTIRLTPNPYSSLVEIETRFGTMKVELFFDAQGHRANFLKLAKESFYDSLLFHRVIKGFMAQGGDPNSRNAVAGARLGAGATGEQQAAEIGQHYYHIKGALAAARQPDEINPEKASSGSQFYIVQGSSVAPIQLDKNEREYDMVYTEEQRKLYYQLGGAPQLDMEYTVFGRVYEGFEVIDKICAVSTDAYARPEKDVKMVVRIIRE